MTPPPNQNLLRELGVFGATMMGLGSIIGTGVFVSIGTAAGVTGPSVVLAIAVAAGVALCNALSSAQLAANHPVSGGTYEYGYRWISPAAGFTAGWMFLCAKTASAATAALGFAGYLLNLIGSTRNELIIPIGLLAVILLTILVLSGIRRSNAANIIIVSLTLAALGTFIVSGLPRAAELGQSNFVPFFVAGDQSGDRATSFLYATALMFVAYTGYGRIATLGEEVHEPRRTIPRAIIAALAASAVIYIVVAAVAIGAAGAGATAAAANEQAATLVVIAHGFDSPAVRVIVALGAMTAMLGVLLNLILGLSRVALAMGRRGDLPRTLGRLNTSGTTPVAAVIVVGIFIAALTFIGSVKTTWTFSAFTVLIYYALTNAAALRMNADERLYPRWIAWIGLIACLGVAVWVPWEILLAGLLLIAAGLIWQRIAKGLDRRSRARV